MGCRALGSLAHRLVEFANLILETGVAVFLQFWSIGQFFVPEGKRIKSFWKDYSEYCKDMDLNRWTEKRVFCVLLGAAQSVAWRDW